MLEYAVINYLYKDELELGQHLNERAAKGWRVNAIWPIPALTALSACVVFERTVSS